jgi:ribosomal-protein-alanine N-acetyltransferase
MTDDVDKIMAVMTTAFDPVYGEAWNRRQVDDALRFGTCHYALTDAQAQSPAETEMAAGFFMSRTGYEEEELLLLAVDPQYRGRGLARSLLDRLRLDAASRGAGRLLLEM